MLSNPSKRRLVASGAFIAAVAGTVAAVNPAASADVLSAAQSAVLCATTTACVSGANTKAGPGVSATSKTGTAMTASGVAGLTAAGTTGAGVSGTSTKYFGVSGTVGASGREGVFGSASSPNAAGVYGTNAAGGNGVEGFATNGTGVLGISGSATAVAASSNSGYGVFASTGGSGTAIEAQSQAGYGLQAVSSGQPSVYGVNSNGDGAEFSGTYIGVIGIAPSSGGLPFVAFDQNSNDVFQVTGTGDVEYTGSLHQLSRVSGGALVKSYAPMSSAPTVEDIGSAQLISGVAAVRLNPTFAASIDGTTTYHVFLTPDGDTRGLYVAARTPTGFIVRETQGGRATLAFDYRIIAAARGKANEHMALVSSSEFAQAPLTTTPTKARPLSGAPVSQHP